MMSDQCYKKKYYFFALYNAVRVGVMGVTITVEAMAAAMGLRGSGDPLKCVSRE